MVHPGQGALRLSDLQPWHSDLINYPASLWRHIMFITKSVSLAYLVFSYLHCRQRDNNINIKSTLRKVPIIFLTFLNSSNDFGKNPQYIIFYSNTSSGSRNLPCGQAKGRMDGHDEANSHVSQCFANQPKHCIIPQQFNLWVVRSYNNHRTSPSKKLDFVIETVFICELCTEYLIIFR